MAHRDCLLILPICSAPLSFVRQAMGLGQGKQVEGWVLRAYPSVRCPSGSLSPNQAGAFTSIDQTTPHPTALPNPS